MNLKKGALLFLLLTCLAYTTLAQTNYELQGSDVTIENGIITGCTYGFDTSDDSKGTNLTIPKSVTKDSETIIIRGIQYNVFKEKNLVAVAFANDSEVTTIGESAFRDNSIVTLTLPTTLKTIGESAFRDNPIVTLTLPTTLTSIGNSAFQRNENAGDNKITELILPTTLETIGKQAFQYNKIAKLTIPGDSQLETIEEQAFQYSQIEGTLTLPATLKTIRNYAFQYNQITKLTFSNVATLTTIGTYAFENNDIETLSLPPTLTTIGRSAFQNNSLTSVAFKVDLNKSQIKSIGSNAFSGNTGTGTGTDTDTDTGLAGITLPQHAGGDDVTYKDSGDENNSNQVYNPGQVFKNFDRSLVAVFLAHTLTAEDGVTVVAGIITECTCNFLSNSIEIPEKIDGETITGIGDNAFSGKSLVAVAFAAESKITSIGSYAFFNNEIATLTFHDDLTTIGSFAFGNNLIGTLTLPPSLMVIGESAFQNNSLTTVIFKDSNKSQIQSIGSNAFSSNTGLAGITLPELDGGTGVTYKDSNDQVYQPGATFTNFERSIVMLYTLQEGDLTVDYQGIITVCLRCEEFVSKRIIIPEKIGDITITGIVDKTWPDKGVFQEKNLVAVAFASDSKVTTIGSFAFKTNPIVTLTLPTSLTTIGNQAFQNNLVTTLTVPASLTTMGSSAFYNNEIKTLTLPTTLTTIGEYVFYDNQITELTFPENSKLTTIGQWAFGANQITELTLPTTLTSIGKSAFAANPSLESFTLPSITKKGFRTYWQDGDSKDLGTNLTITDFGKSFKLVSIEQVTLTVEVNDKEGGSIEPPDDRFVIDKADPPSTQELTAKPNDGWRFDKWVITSGEDGNGNPITETFDVDYVDVTADADKTATAYFVKLVTLTTSVEGQQGGTISATPNHSLEDNQYDINTKVTLTATPNDGWRFDKWIITSGEDGNGNSITETVDVVGVEVTADADKTATAHFVKLVILTTAVAEQQGGTIARLVEPNNDKEEYDINTKVTLTATPNDGWRFDKWVISDEENKTDKTTTITLDKNKTATAHFVEQVTLTLIIEETEASGEVNGLSAGKNKIDKGADFKLKATPASGQRFVSWTIGVETIVTEEYTLPATDTEADIGITVTFEAIPLDNQVTLTLDIVGEGSTTPDKGENIYKKDKDVELTATPNEGWKFDKWVIGTDEITENPTTITLNQDKTVTAHFVQLVTLTTSVEGQQGGTISTTPKPSLEDNQYDINTKVTLTAKPDEGWKFDKWVIGTDEITENPTTITLDQDKTVTAHFVEGEEAITSILTEVVSATPYPNPVTSQITLKAKDGDLIQLFSQKGKQQYSTQHTGNEVHIIDVSTIPVGVYLVRITDAEGNTTTKRILKK